MRSVKNDFTGNISSDCQQQSVPTELITLVNMLLEGNNVTHFTNQNVLTCHSFCYITLNQEQNI